MPIIDFAIGSDGVGQFRLDSGEELTILDDSPLVEELFSFKLFVNEDDGNITYLDGYLGNGDSKRPFLKAPAGGHRHDTVAIVRFAAGKNSQVQRRLYINGELHAVDGDAVEDPWCALEYEITHDGESKLVATYVRYKDTGKLVELADCISVGYKEFLRG